MDKIDELLTRGVEKIYPTKEALEKALKTGNKLKVFQGFDPTGIQLHIGHMAGLLKLRQFQNLGHHVIFLIGDGTGQAGDPSGKTRTREKFLTQEELKQNARDYVLQAGKIVSFHGENPVEILYNGDWLNKLRLPNLLDIASHFTLQQLEERDMFQERKKRGEDINFREFLYPLLQGYDSVAMKIDLEIGGVDQTFNMLAGRKLVRDYLHKEKFVLTLPLLADSSGKKIGKTEGNVIALNAKPNDFYGMIMSLPDDVIVKCFELITDVPMDDITRVKKALEGDANPMEYKKILAYTLTRMLNNETEAKMAQENFESTFQKREAPKDIATMVVKDKTTTSLTLLVKSKLVKSKSEAKRLLSEGAIEYNGSKLTDPQADITIVNGAILKVGKHRFIKTI